MWRIFKIIAQKLYQPIIAKRIGRGDNYEYDGITLFIPAGVFHPRYFFSTKYLLSELKKLNLVNKRFLELGAGNGLISISAAKHGAQVTASDISELVVKTLKQNALDNNVSIQIIKSDLFNQIPKQTFDIIAINPPYYPKQARNDLEMAWYCGVNFEYFHVLFSQIKGYMDTSSLVLMVLSDGCDIPKITSIAKTNGLSFTLFHQQKIWWEKEFIFRIQ
jgi:release factor glutamine methyltransferase